MGMESSVVPFGMNDQMLARRIAQVAQDSSKVILMPHAKKRMRERNILWTQIIQVLRKGLVVEHAHRNIRGNWQCTLKLLVAGDEIKLAAVLQENEAGESVIVLTVMN